MYEHALVAYVCVSIIVAICLLVQSISGSYGVCLLLWFAGLFLFSNLFSKQLKRQEEKDFAERQKPLDL